MELLEATGKKAAFLRKLIDALGLEDVAVHHGRAEDLGREPSLRGAFDAVLARGVARLATLVELTLPFLRIGGVLVAQKSADVDAEVDGAAEAVRTLGGAAPVMHSVSAPGLDDGRTLVVAEKVSATRRRSTLGGRECPPSGR